MSLKEKLMNQILNNSNSYNYFKNTHNALIKENEQLKNEVSLKKKEISQLKQQLINQHEGFIFSIVMAIYNTEEYLTEAIDSLINQSFPFNKVQLILVDDGSSDKSGKIAKKYAQKYSDNIIYIYQKNNGQSSARNNGLAHVKGRYVNFLDSDDKLEKNVLYEVFSYFNLFNDEIDIISIPRYLFGAINKPMHFNHMYTPNRVVDIEKEINLPITSISSSFIKKTALNDKFDERVIISEDSLLLNKIIIDKSKFGVVGSCNYMYRKRLNGDSTIDTKKNKKEYFNPRMEFYFKELINTSVKKHGYVLKYIQNVLMYDLQWLFQDNTEYGVLNDEETKEFYSNINDVLSNINDEVILKSNLNKFYKYHILNFKNNLGEIKKHKDDLAIYYNNQLFDKLSNYKIKITEFKKGNLKGYFLFYNIGNFNINAYDGDNQLDLNIYKIKKTYSTNTIISNKYYFELKTDNLNKLNFKLTHNSNTYPLKIDYNKKLKNIKKIDEYNLIIDS